MLAIENAMTVDEARHLTERIRHTAATVAESVEKLRGLVEEAKDGDAHLLLGYASWTAYISDVLGAQPLRLERDVRRELVGYLSEQGMTTRTIAPIVGVSHKTVVLDRQVVPDVPPAAGVASATPEPRMVTGRDGKQYPAQRSTPERELVVDTATGEVFDPMTITTTSSLRTDDEWACIAEKAKNYRTAADAHAALAPDVSVNYFGVRMSRAGVEFMHYRTVARLTDQANGLIERLGENILSYAEGGHEVLEVAALDLVDPEVTRRALEQLAKATTEIKLLIKTLSKESQK